MHRQAVSLNYFKSATSSVTFWSPLGPTSIFFPADKARSTAALLVDGSTDRNAITWYSPGVSPPIRNRHGVLLAAPKLPVWIPKDEGDR